MISFNLQDGWIDFEAIQRMLEEIEQRLSQKARADLAAKIFEVDSFEEFEEIMREGKGLALAGWDGTPQTEDAVKEKTSATIRVLKNEQVSDNVKCVYSGKPAKFLAYWGLAY